MFSASTIKITFMPNIANYVHMYTIAATGWITIQLIASCMVAFQQMTSEYRVNKFTAYGWNMC